MAVQATLADMKGPVQQFYSPNDNHGMNYPGAKYMIHYFNHYGKGTEPELPIIVQQKNKEEQVSFTVQQALDIVKAEVWYSTGRYFGGRRKWKMINAMKQGDHYVATLPANQKINWYPVI